MSQRVFSQRTRDLHHDEVKDQENNPNPIHNKKKHHNTNTLFLEPVKITQNITLGESLNRPNPHLGDKIEDEETWSDLRFNSSNYVQDCARKLELIFEHQHSENDGYISVEFKRFLQSDIVRYLLAKGSFDKHPLIKNVKSKSIQDMIDYATKCGKELIKKYDVKLGKDKDKDNKDVAEKSDTGNVKSWAQMASDAAATPVPSSANKKANKKTKNMFAGLDDENDLSYFTNKERAKEQQERISNVQKAALIYENKIKEQQNERKVQTDRKEKQKGPPQQQQQQQQKHQQQQQQSHERDEQEEFQLTNHHHHHHQNEPQREVNDDRGDDDDADDDNQPHNDGSHNQNLSHIQHNGFQPFVPYPPPHSNYGYQNYPPHYYQNYNYNNYYRGRPPSGHGQGYYYGPSAPPPHNMNYNPPNYSYNYNRRNSTGSSGNQSRDDRYRRSSMPQEGNEAWKPNDPKQESTAANPNPSGTTNQSKPPVILLSLTEYQRLVDAAKSNPEKETDGATTEKPHNPNTKYQPHYGNTNQNPWVEQSQHNNASGPHPENLPNQPRRTSLAALSQSSLGLSNTDSTGTSLSRKERRKAWYQSYLENHPDEKQQFLQGLEAKHQRQRDAKMARRLSISGAQGGEKASTGRRASIGSNYDEVEDGFVLY